MIVGNNISNMDDVHETQWEILEYIRMNTDQLLDKLKFLAKPKVINRVFVASFYNQDSDRIKYIINAIESMSKSISFTKPEDDFGGSGSIFYLYPMQWMDKNNRHYVARDTGTFAGAGKTVSKFWALPINAIAQPDLVWYLNDKTDKTQLKLERLKQTDDGNDNDEKSNNNDGYKYRIYFNQIDKSYWSEGAITNYKIESIDIQNVEFTQKMITEKGSNPLYPHDLIIFKVFDFNDDEFYLISKSGYPSWFAYESTMGPQSGLWFYNGDPTEKGYWKWET